jgi:hypothetical protein
MMSKWKFWKKVVDHEPVVKSDEHACPYCGKHVLRQTTLSEFADLTPETQQRLPLEMTERVGMKSEKRNYRGSI